MASSDWVPALDALGDYPDRQVLVIGDGVVGLVLAALLGRGGYDPLVASNGRPVRSRVSYLWPSALAVLDELGVGSRVRDRGVTVDGASVRAYDVPGTNATVFDGPVDATAGPLVVGTRDLRHALESRLPEVGTKRVETVSRREDGLRVAFADGVREWFDVVVATGPGGRSFGPADRDGRGHDTLAQYETTVDADVGTRIREVYHPGAVVQQVPHPGEQGSLLRVTAAKSALPATLTGDSEERRGGSNEGGEKSGADEGTRQVRPQVARALAEVEPTSVRQTRLEAVDPGTEWWGIGRRAFCGAGACPLAPASGFAVSFGIGDAQALASELTVADRTTTALVDAYASRRCRRFRDIRRDGALARAEEQSLPTTTEQSLDVVASLRRVALRSHLTGSQ